MTLRWLHRVLGLDETPDSEAEAVKDAEVDSVITASRVARQRADRAITDYRRADDSRAVAATASRAAGERLIDEVERDR